jgi:hypothetical protein
MLTVVCVISMGLCSSAASGVIDVTGVADELQLEDVTVNHINERSVYENAAFSGCTIMENGFSMLPGWPNTMGTDPLFASSRGMVWADLDHDHYPEVIASSTDNMIYVWDHQGQPLSGWPVSVIGMAQAAPSAGDIDNDGDIEIVQGTRGWSDGGRLYAFEADGTVMPNFPLDLNNHNISASVTLADLDLDGDLELLAAERDYPIGYLHVFHHDGSPYGASWPVELDHVPTGTPAVGDIDNDGLPEVIHMSYQTLYVYDRDGNVMWDWSGYPDARFSYQSPALGDMTDDGFLEIAVCTHWDNASLMVFRYDGAILDGFPKYFGSWSYSPPTIADVDGDGYLDVLAGKSGGTYPGNNLFAYDLEGNSLPGWPVNIAGGVEGPVIVGDIDDDGSNEVIFDSNLMEEGQGWLHAVDCQANYLADWPLRPTGFTYMNGAVLGDLNQDGVIDVGTVSHDDYHAYVSIWSLEAEYHQERIEWPVYHFDNEHTGRYRPSEGGEIVTIDAEPELVIARRGEVCSYDVTLANTTDEGQTFQVWLDLFLPGGKPYPGNPFLGPLDIHLRPGQRVTRSISETIPQFAPLGTYTLDFNAGIYDINEIFDHDEVNLEIVE